MTLSLKDPKNWAFAITEETMVNGDGISCANVYPLGQPDYDQGVTFDFQALDRDLDEPFEAHLSHPSPDPGVLADILRNAGLTDESPERFVAIAPYLDPIQAGLSDFASLPTSGQNAELLRKAHAERFTTSDAGVSGSSANEGHHDGFSSAALTIWRGEVIAESSLADDLAEIRLDEPDSYVRGYEQGWRKAVAERARREGLSPRDSLARSIGEAWAKRDRERGLDNAAPRLRGDKGWNIDAGFLDLVADAYQTAWTIS